MLGNQNEMGRAGNTLNTLKFNKNLNITSRLVLTLTRKQTLFVALSLNATRAYLLREGVQKTLLRGHVPYQGGGPYR